MDAIVREAPERPISRAFGPCSRNRNKWRGFRPPTVALRNSWRRRSGLEVPDLELPIIPDPDPGDVPTGLVRLADVDLGTMDLARPSAPISRICAVSSSTDWGASTFARSTSSSWFTC